MKKMGLSLLIVVSCLFWTQANGLAETMYVTDRLYLSLRSEPDAELPTITLLPSDTEIEVLSTEGQWAQVRLLDGGSGWVMKRFLVEDVPKSVIIEQLKQTIAKKDVLLEKLQAEMASLKERSPEQATTGANEDVLKRKIADLKNQILQQRRQVEARTKQQTLERLKNAYMIGIIALFVGLLVGYFLGKPRKRRQTFSPYL
jgi:SH3 domain protein